LIAALDETLNVAIDETWIAALDETLNVAIP